MALGLSLPTVTRIFIGFQNTLKYLNLLDPTVFHIFYFYCDYAVFMGTAAASYCQLAYKSLVKNVFSLANFVFPVKFVSFKEKGV